MYNNYKVLCVYLVVKFASSSQEQTIADQFDEINKLVAEFVINEANRPIWFELENPVDSFIGRTSELSELKLGQPDNKITIITGPRGIGKTELARKFAQEIKHDNTSSILWIDSRTHESLITSIKDLAVIIGNSIEGKNVPTIIKDTFSFFNNKRTLFIMDHAFSDNIIIKNLQYFLNNTVKINIIVTSRDENWDDSYKIMKLQPFTNEDSLEYLRTVLGKECNMHVVNSSAEKLSELLKNLPLAFSKATQYIIQQNTVASDREYTIDSYILDLQHHISPTEPTPEPEPTPVNELDEKIEEGIKEKVQEETARIGKQIEGGVSHAWESMTGEVGRSSKKISNEVGRFSKRVSGEARRVEKRIRKIFG